ncbi:MAG: ATP-binding protein [Candidatus Wildermuthbacteria bacterium]|nr:ATP-binding protein [Candidatus Wildermuthbacteria bacterium]
METDSPKIKEDREAKLALLNILEDTEEARNRAEEERKKTATIISNLVDGLMVFDKDNNLTLFNPRVKEFFVEIPDFNSLANLLGKEAKNVFRQELQAKEGLTIEVTAVPLVEEGEKTGTIVVLHDVTREKRIESMKTEFVSLAAHQLRTPLSAIKWSLRMILDGDLGEISKEQKDFISKTYQSNERMISLINDLLDVTRIEEGKYLFKPAITGIGAIVQFVIGSYKEEFAKRGLKLEFNKPDEDLSKAMIDVEKIRLVIQNLLDNAVKYTAPGGTVTVSLRDTGKNVEFRIKDTGVGIPEDQKGRIFTKFFRGANVVKMETEGSGLGLFIAKNIIEAHGGRIWFDSQEGKGATFYFTLPAKEEFSEFLKEF